MTAPLPIDGGPLPAYRARLRGGGLKPDPAQALAVEKLQSLHKALEKYRPATGSLGWRERFGLGRQERAAPPQGLYICGDVGRGKSMLMDLFYESATIPGKKRIHFQAFMRDIHDQIHRWRQASGGKVKDPIPRLAREIAVEAWLLCLDELEIHDITDAMIVGKLFEELLANGVVVVTTSNRVPDDLYKDGLQREKFLPFIGLIKDTLDVLVLEAACDYRRGRLRGMKVFHHPLDAETEMAIDEMFLHLGGGYGQAKPSRLFSKGREIVIPAAAHGVAKFSFADLCEQPLGPGDYLTLAGLYPTVILTDIPKLGSNKADAARRFVTLIDALYEHRTMLICSAAAAPEALYTDGKGAFEFQRTVSRLMEMQSEDYLGLCHLT